MITILFFASLRETLGVGRETLDVSVLKISDVGALVVRLRQRSATFADALAPANNWRVAVNQVMAHAQTPIAAGDEVAFFPPVTGG